MFWLLLSLLSLSPRGIWQSSRSTTARCLTTAPPRQVSCHGCALWTLVLLWMEKPEKTLAATALYALPTGRGKRFRWRGCMVCAHVVHTVCVVLVAWRCRLDPYTANRSPANSLETGRVTRPVTSRSTTLLPRFRISVCAPTAFCAPCSTPQRQQSGVREPAAARRRSSASRRPGPQTARTANAAAS